VIYESLLRIGRYDEAWDSEPKTIGVYLWRRNMIIPASIIIPGYEYCRGGPELTLHDGVDQGYQISLPDLNVCGWVVALILLRNNPYHIREVAILQVDEELIVGRNVAQPLRVLLE
jgi:hypothetical protein